MSSSATISPRDRLITAATAWTEATGRSTGALSSLVMNDGKTLGRLIDDPARAVYDTTLARFAQFLADPANWPEGKVGDEAKALAHVMGVSLPDAALSAGKLEDISRSERAA